MNGELTIIDKESAAETLLFSSLNQPGEVFGFDTETVGIDPRKQSPVGNGQVVCWSLAHGNKRWFIWGEFLELFKPFLESTNHYKVGHNIFSFDKHILGNHGIQLNGIAADTLHLSRLLYCSKERSHGLKALAKTRLKIEQPSYASLFSRPTHGVGKGRTTVGKSKRSGIPTVLGTEWSTVGSGRELIPLDRIREDYPQRLEALYEYASLDAYITLKLYHQMLPELERKPWRVYK